jgi:adenylate cyclase
VPEWLRTWLDRAVSIGAAPDDDPETRLLKRVASGASWMLLLFSLAWWVGGFFPFRPLSLVVSLGFFSAVGGSLVRFATSKDLRRFVLVLLASGLVVTLLGQLTLGGFAGSSAAAAWGIVAPVSAELVLGPRRAFRWFATYLGIIAVLVIADPLVLSLANTPYPMGLAFFALNMVGPAGISFVMLRYIDAQRRDAQEQSDRLLLNVLPAPIAARLRAGEATIAEQHADVSVLFADVVDFTPFSERAEPADVVRLLDRLFSAFDAVAERHGLEKIKTIGDAYMAVAGIPQPVPDHASAAVAMALEMHEQAARERDPQGRPIRLRIGIASGPVVAGVIGRRKFAYDLWGDTVNTASRMESAGVPGCLQVTPATFALTGDRYPFRRRDDVAVKGKGSMTTYLLDPRDLEPVAPGAVPVHPPAPIPLNGSSANA